MKCRKKIQSYQTQNNINKELLSLRSKYLTTKWFSENVLAI